ncbi:hypothetical protein GBAR_LOCUS3892 [Geodia barretti]|uniref:DUF11 domain-containing protein n=1 Tax=Geodia barretti TaxID=519541 RepID=A0AA35R4T7_GEOBA|nr:hypothetical protein GBAR_LOCUS3892 [Geodia barretti]
MFRQGAAFWFVLVLGLLMAALIIGGGFYLAVQQGAVELGSAPDMEVTMSAAPSTVAAGESVTYTTNYTNKGENPAGSVSLTVTLPQGTTIGEIVPAAACTPSESTVVCRLGDAESGEAGQRYGHRDSSFNGDEGYPVGGGRRDRDRHYPGY